MKKSISMMSYCFFLVLILVAVSPVCHVRGIHLHLQEQQSRRDNSIIQSSSSSESLLKEDITVTALASRNASPTLLTVSSSPSLLADNSFARSRSLETYFRHPIPLKIVREVTNYRYRGN
jgi:hypothetical protein